MFDSEKKGFSEHKVMLCLDKELYRAFIRLQADKELGRSYAGLLPWVEGMFHMGFISKEVRDSHVARYSEPLVQNEVVRCGFKGCVNEAVGLALYIPRNQQTAYCRDHAHVIQEQRDVWKVMK